MAKKENLTLEEVLAIVDKVGGRNTQMQTAVPTVQVQKPDSFEVLTGGILKGWPFITMLVGSVLWISQSIFSINSTLQAHDTRIIANTAAIKAVEDRADSQAVAQNASNNDVVRRLDNLQKDVDILKTK